MTICLICHKESCTCKRGHPKSRICCVEVQSAKVQNDHFGSPFPCPEQFPTKRFSSPNSPLPPELLDELQRCIEVANDLLRSLGNQRNPNNMRRLQLQLLQLQGIPIKATVDCQKKVSGLLGTAGRDFVQINTHGQFVFILYEQLISLEWDQDAKLDHEPEFLKTDKETRRQMVFNFGEFVGKRPELVNLFFGLTLQQYLMDFLGKKILIKTIDHYNIKGILSNSDGVRVQIMTQNGLQEIDWGTICYMEIMDLRA